MKQKNYFNDARRSRWLPTLVMLLAMFAGGVSPAWADAKALPYSYDFEDADELANWSLVSCAPNTGRNTTTKRNGSYAFRFYYNTNPPQYLISPELTGTTNGVEVTFYYKSHTAGTETFHVGYSTTTAETSAFTFGDEISISYQSSWSTYNNTFPAGTKYVAIKYTSNDKYYLYIDDISFTAPPTCIAPTGLTTDNITSTSVDLSWTSDADAWNIQYKLATEDDWTDVSGNITTKAYTLSGLTPAKTYQVRVRTYCSNSDQSAWTDAVNFTTDCATVTIDAGHSFSEDFSAGNTLPNCWTINNENKGSSGSGWTISSNMGYSGYYGDTYLILPAMELSVASQLVFDNYFNYASDYNGTTAKSSIVISTTGKTAADFSTTLYTFTKEELPASSSTSLPKEISLAAYTGQTVYIAFKYEGNNAHAWYVDNVVVEQAPACPKPTALTASNPTWQGATLSWTAGSDETEWKVVYGAAGFDPASAGTTIDNVTENPYTLTGLTAETEYDVYVKAVKGGDVSPVSNKANFTTTERYPAPTGLEISNVAPTSATLTWTAAAATSWEVAVNTTGETPATDAGTGIVANAATYDFSELTAETTYYAFVRVKDGDNYSNWSAACEFTPSANTYLTVNEGTTTNSYVPVYGYFTAAANLGGQFIIPAANLTDVQNKIIKKLTFYSNAAEYAFGDAEFDVCVKEVSDATMSSSMYAWDTSWTTVYSGTLAISGNKMNIVFTSDFNYTGSNLLIGIHKTSTDKAGSNYNVSFYGNNSSSYMSNYNPNGNRQKFQPKTTIGYQAKTGSELKVYDGETELAESPASFDFGFVAAGTTHTFTLKNTAATSYTATVSSTNLTIDPTTAITPDADGETFTITMPDHDITNEPVVITPEDGKGLSAFTINVSGRYRDMDKLYYDFTSGASIPSAWTNSGWNIGGYGVDKYISASSEDAAAPSRLITSRMAVANGGETLAIKAKKTDDAGTLVVYYAATKDGFTDENKTAVTTLNTTDYTTASVTVPEGMSYVAFDGYKVCIAELYGLADAPTMRVRTTADGANLANNMTVDFGLTSTADSKTYYVVNEAAGTLAGIDATLAGTGFTLNKMNLTDAGGDFTIAIDTEVKGYREATITVSGTNQDNFVINLKGFVAGEEGKMDVTFDDNQLPANWTNAETNPWEFADGKAHTKSNNTANAILTTCKLTVAANEVLAIKAKGENSNSELKVHVYQNGNEITAKKATFDSQVEASTSDYTTLYFTGLEAGDYKLVFDGWKVYIDEVAGFTVNANDPALAIYSNSEATEAVTTATTKDFGWVANTADATAFTATYYVKNVGTGTLTISNISEVEGFTATTAENAMTVSGENTLALTITMDKTAAGEKNSTFTLTTDGGNFEIPVKGFVYGDRNLIDFSSAAQTAGWNKGTWTIEENVASVAAASTMQTTSFIVNANEKLYVEAKRTADNYSTGSLSYSYSTNNGESWTDGEAALFSATGSSDYDTYTISDIAGNEERTVLIRFNGAYAAINRIYGFEAIHVAEMVVSQTAPIAFGMQTEETTETSFTISNANGSKTLEGLSVTLGKTSEDAEYEVRMEKDDAAFTGTEIAVGEVVTVFVKQLFDINNLGAKSDVLTIAATDKTPVTINLSGATRDASKLYVDFDGSNDWPAAIASHGANWEVYAGYARQNSTTASSSSLVLAPLTISDASDALHFKVSRVDANRDLTVRYTTNGGVTWNDYNFGTNETPVTSLKEQITSTSSYNDFEITNIPAGTVAFDFFGQSVKLDNITADYSLTNAPLVAFTKVTDNISDANLTADAEATYTLANNGNANYVGTVAKSNVNVAISGEGVTYEDNTLTIPAGKTAEITVTMPFAAPYGAKNGSMTITSESWVGDVAVNYTANLIDPEAINVDFASLPDGWYNDGWTVDGSAHVYSGVEKEFISEQFAAEAGKNVLSFKAKAQSGNEGTLKVYTSTDRKSWGEATEIILTGEYQDKSLETLADGNYYVKFVSMNANIDDLVGLKKIATVPEHDLYVSASNIPTDTKVPGTEITATATVYSLRAAETGVYAKLFFGDAVVATATAEDISLNGSKDFTLTGNVPAEEGTYAAKIVVYYSDNSVASETAATDVKVEHTRTLAIQSFFRDGEGAMDADANNQISPSFKVTVKNTGTTALTPIIKVKQSETVVGTATGTELAADATSDEITVAATNMSAGEGGELSFTAEAYWSSEDGATAFTFETPVTITVKAAAPKFELAEGSTALNDGDAVAFGLTKSTVVKTYTISNTGNNTLEVSAISAPEGFEAAYAEKNRDDAEWMLYLYKSDDVKDDVATFKQTGVANQFYVENVEITSNYAGGTNFCVRNSDWSTKYGWKDGNTVTETGKAFELATAEGATGWMTLAAGTYNVIFDASNLTITFQPQATKAIFAGESRDVNVTLKAEQGKVSGNLAFTYKVDANTNATFTLALSGRSIAANTWTEDFATGIPASWENNGWTVDEGVAYSGGYETVQTLMTPRLAAANGEEMTYDATFKYTGYTLKVEYSTDKTNWTEYATINDATVGEQSFVAPAEGNYYLRFTGTRYAQLDNFVGFTLNIPEHDTEIAAASIPSTGTQYGTYTATVTLKENAGKAEEVTAILYVDGDKQAVKTETITANGSTVVIVTWKPEAVITDAVEAYIKVTADGIDLATDKVNLTIAAPFTLSDTEAPTFAEATTTYEALVLNREFVEGWNTVCLPFAITDIEEFFGDGAKAYTLNSYVAAENTLKFESATTMNASYPYVVYVPAAIASGKVVENVEIGSQYDTPSTTATYFVGTYAPIDDMSGKWGIGTAKDGNAKIMKGKAGSQMKGFRAYFALPGNTQGAPTMMFDEEVITGISAIEMAAEEGERIYNLNGQRVMNPKKGQMYIVNGKKVAIK